VVHEGASAEVAHALYLRAKQGGEGA